MASWYGNGSNDDREMEQQARLNETDQSFNNFYDMLYNEGENRDQNVGHNAEQANMRPDQAGIDWFLEDTDKGRREELRQNDGHGTVIDNPERSDWFSADLDPNPAKEKPRQNEGIDWLVPDIVHEKIGEEFKYHEVQQQSTHNSDVINKFFASTTGSFERKEESHNYRYDAPNNSIYYAGQQSTIKIQEQMDTRAAENDNEFSEENIAVEIPISIMKEITEYNESSQKEDQRVKEERERLERETQTAVAVIQEKMSRMQQDNTNKQTLLTEMNLLRRQEDAIKEKANVMHKKISQDYKKKKVSLKNKSERVICKITDSLGHSQIPGAILQLETKSQQAVMEQKAKAQEIQQNINKQDDEASEEHLRKINGLNERLTDVEAKIRMNPTNPEFSSLAHTINQEIAELEITECLRSGQAEQLKVAAINESYKVCQMIRTRRVRELLPEWQQLYKISEETKKKSYPNIPAPGYLTLDGRKELYARKESSAMDNDSDKTFQVETIMQGIPASMIQEIKNDEERLRIERETFKQLRAREIQEKEQAEKEIVSNSQSVINEIEQAYQHDSTNAVASRMIELEMIERKSKLDNLNTTWSAMRKQSARKHAKHYSTLKKEFESVVNKITNSLDNSQKPGAIVQVDEKFEPVMKALRLKYEENLRNVNIQHDKDTKEHRRLVNSVRDKLYALPNNKEYSELADKLNLEITHLESMERNRIADANQLYTSVQHQHNKERANFRSQRLTALCGAWKQLYRETEKSKNPAEPNISADIGTESAMFAKMETNEMQIQVASPRTASARRRKQTESPLEKIKKSQYSRADTQTHVGQYVASNFLDAAGRPHSNNSAKNKLYKGNAKKQGTKKSGSITDTMIEKLAANMKDTAKKAKKGKETRQGSTYQASAAIQQSQQLKQRKLYSEKKKEKDKKILGNQGLEEGHWKSSYGEKFGKKGKTRQGKAKGKTAETEHQLQTWGTLQKETEKKQQHRDEQRKEEAAASNWGIQEQRQRSNAQGQSNSKWDAVVDEYKDSTHFRGDTGSW